MDLADYRSGICDTEHLCSARDDYRNCEGCKWRTYNWCQCKGTGHNSRYNYGFGRKVSVKASSGAVLQVSYIGYVTEKIQVGNRTGLTITLKEDSHLVDEVVVVGYGTQRKSI